MIILLLIPLYPRYTIIKWFVLTNRWLTRSQLWEFLWTYNFSKNGWFCIKSTIAIPNKYQKVTYMYFVSPGVPLFDILCLPKKVDSKSAHSASWNILDALDTLDARPMRLLKEKVCQLKTSASDIASKFAPHGINGIQLHNVVHGKSPLCTKS